MKDIKIIINFLKERFPTIQGIYLFGSRADGTARPDSDFDLGVLLPYGEKLDGLKKFDLANELASKLGHDVDLLNLRELYTDVQFQVVAYGERVYTADEYACDTFDMLTFSMFQKHKERTKFIVQDIKERGYIYERNNHSK